MKTLSVVDVVRRALTRPGHSWHLVLQFVATANEIEDCSRISQDIPWLPKLGSGIETLFRDLRQRGLAVIACGDEWEALRLQGLVERLRALPPEDPRLDSAQRQALDQDAEWPKRIVSFLVRPFDRRFLLYANDFLERSRQKVMAHLERGDNLALLACRQSRGEPGVFVTRWIAGHKAASVYDVSSVFPLYLDSNSKEGGNSEAGPRVPNLAPGLLASLAERYGEAPTPEEILGYVYAVLYDPTYRERYKTFLRRDFPRILFARERETFLHLATLGTELIGLHLLADRRLVAPPVGVLGDPGRRLGSGRRTLLRYEPKKSRLYVNDGGLGFSGISPEVYRYGIGGYNVLAGWLRPRSGRVLLSDEIRTFRRIASALTLTLEVQEKIAAAGGGYEEAS